MLRGTRGSAFLAFWERVPRPTVVAPFRRDDEIAKEDPWGRHGSCSEPAITTMAFPHVSLGDGNDRRFRTWNIRDLEGEPDKRNE